MVDLAWSAMFVEDNRAVPLGVGDELPSGSGDESVGDMQDALALSKPPSRGPDWLPRILEPEGSEATTEQARAEVVFQRMKAAGFPYSGPHAIKQCPGMTHGARGLG